MDRNFRFINKIAVITGGSSGIGREICKIMANEGATIIIADINEQGAQETINAINLINNKHKEISFIKTDVTIKEQVLALFDRVIQQYGSIHILINCAGTDIKGKITELSESTWDKILNLNLKGTFLCTQNAIIHMEKQKYGRILNISSMAGKTGEPFTSPYCASKFGVIGFTQAVALEVGKSGITVNALCPGPVNTELIKKSILESSKLSGRSYEEELEEKFLKKIPLGRLAEPIDIANAVAFLVSDEASYITGTTLNVSGGIEMH